MTLIRKKKPDANTVAIPQITGLSNAIGKIMTAMGKQMRVLLSANALAENNLCQRYAMALMMIAMGR